jgi:hypothetical protein
MLRNFQLSHRMLICAESLLVGFGAFISMIVSYCAIQILSSRKTLSCRRKNISSFARQLLIQGWNACCAAGQRSARVVCAFRRRREHGVAVNRRMSRWQSESLRRRFGATAGLVVLTFLRCGRRRFRLQHHAAFWAVAGMVLHHLRVHRTGVSLFGDACQMRFLKMRGHVEVKTRGGGKERAE